MRKPFVAALAVFFTSLSLHGGVVESTVEYGQGGVKLEGFRAFDDRFAGKRPAVLVIHQWTGLSDYERMRARMLAELGYNVLAADVYGAGVRPQPPAAGEEAGKYKSDRRLFRDRLLAALDVLKKDELTDASRIAVIGYCFGGTGALELAREGAGVTGVVSFHGGLASASGMEAKRGGVTAKVLVLHGAIDPYVPPAEVGAFQAEMSAAAADWGMVTYGGAVHAFTQKSAGDDVSKGVAYNALADERSWRDMRAFLSEIFGEH